MTLIIEKKCTKCECTFRQDELWDYCLGEDGEDVLVEKCPKCGHIDDFEQVGVSSNLILGFSGPDGIGC